MRRRILTILLLILMLPFPSMASDIPGYEGGIMNENTYKEVIFITGDPIVMEGTLDIKVKIKDNTVTETYRYKLQNQLEGAKLDRTVKVVSTLYIKNNQVVTVRSLDSFKETIDVKGVRYQSQDEDYQWNESTITHKRPVLEYFSGDMMSRKTYTVNRDETNTVTVETVGKSYGYNSPWSSTQTQSIEYIIEHKNSLNPRENWTGFATVETSYNWTKGYSYEKNIPLQTSFRGGLSIVERCENVLKYNYDLPRLNGNIVLSGRNLGKNSISLNTVPVPVRLSIPQSRDIAGHKFERELFLLASMDAFPTESIYIGPDSPITRGDFARAVVKCMDIPVEMEEEKTPRSRKKEEPKPDTFKDVDKNHKNYYYIEAVAKKQIMNGKSKENFYPDVPITRAEAYATLMKLIGLENLAPRNRNYTTGYRDDSDIPDWAKDYVYVAKMLGIGEAGDYFYPNNSITKGETAKLIADLINYMQEDLREDYRENLLNH